MPFSKPKFAKASPTAKKRKYPTGKLMRKGTRLKCHGCNDGKTLKGDCEGCNGKGFIEV